MNITRYHLTTVNQINEYGGNPAISGTILDDGNYLTLVNFEDADTDFVESCMDNDPNIIFYRAENIG